MATEQQLLRYVAATLTGKWTPEVGDRVRVRSKEGGLMERVTEDFPEVAGQKGTVRDNRRPFGWVQVVLDDPELASHRLTAYLTERGKDPDCPGYWNCNIHDLVLLHPETDE